MTVFNQGNGNTTQVPSATAKFGFMENGDPKFYNCTPAQIATALDQHWSNNDLYTVKLAPFASIQAAIDHVATRTTPTQGGVVELPSNIILEAGIVLKNRVSLRGQGRGATVIKAPDGANVDVLTIPDSAALVGWSGLTIDGNKDNNTIGSGIVFEAVNSSSGNSFAPFTDKVDTSPESYKHCIASDFVVGNCAEDGIKVNTTNYQVFMNNFACSHNDQEGLSVFGSDGIYSNFYAEKNGRAGLWASGSSNKFTNGKVIWNGQTDNTYGGLREQGTANVFTAVEAQDNYTDGILILGNQPVFVGCSANTNGYSAVGAEGVSSRIHADIRVGASAVGVAFKGEVHSYKTAVGTDGFWTTEYPYYFNSYTASQVVGWDVDYASDKYNAAPNITLNKLLNTIIADLNVFSSNGVDTFMDISPKSITGAGDKTIRKWRNTEATGTSRENWYSPGTANIQHTLTGAGNSNFNAIEGLLQFRGATVLSRLGGVQSLRDYSMGPVHRITLAYHTTDGDGGGGDFRYVFGAAPGTYVDNGGTIIVPTGGDGSAAWLRVGWDGDVLAFGAVSSVTINTAAETLGLSGGGIISIPAGTWTLANTGPGVLGGSGATSWDDRYCILIAYDNVKIVGAGRNATILKLGDNEDAHVVKIGRRVGATISPENCSISGLTIDGNRANQSTPTASENHFNGIDVADGSYQTTLSDLTIHDTQYYGIGFQTKNFRNCTVENALIMNTGADGLDFKDIDGDNRGNRISNVTVRAFGLVSPAVLPLQAGINVRGGVSVSHVEVTDFADDRHGIRVDPNPTTQNITVGPISDFLVVATSAGTTNGVYVNGFPAYVAPCRVVNGEARNTAVGIDARSPEAQIDTVRTQDCGVGIQVLTRSQVTNAHADGSTVSGYVIRDDSNTLTNVYAYNNLVGATIESASSNSSIRGGAFSGNTTNVLDSGTQTGISQVSGINTDTVVTSDFDVATTGIKTIDIAHSLHFTPDIDYSTAIVKRSTAVNDYKIGMVRINAVSATNINCSVDVTTASATGGATATLCIRSIAKKAVRY